MIAMVGRGQICLLIIVHLLGCCFGCTVLPTGGCSEPKKSQRISINDVSEAVHSQTNSLVPGWRNSEKTLEDVPPEFQNIQREHFIGHFNCTESVKAQKNKDTKTKRSRRSKKYLNQVALCPWKYVKNIDENRKPEILIEAVCACNFPISGHSDLFCENVYQYVTVFRRTGCNDDGEYQYEQTTEKLPIACVTVTVPGANKTSKRHSVMGQK